MEPITLFGVVVGSFLFVVVLLYCAGLSGGGSNARFTEVCMVGLKRLIFAIAVVLCGTAVTLVIVSMIRLLES